ncbi:cyclophilin-like fold protein [Amedibacillus sp. YH-ame6]
MRSEVLITICMCVLLVACNDKKQPVYISSPKVQIQTKKERVPIQNNTIINEKKREVETLKELYITINDQSSKIILYDNKTTKELKEILPISFSMEDLHRNEKFVYLNQNFTTNSQTIAQIHKGDIMLFGSNCLVIFYESFLTTFQYTPVGKIENLSVLDKIVGNAVIEVYLEMKE